MPASTKGEARNALARAVFFHRLGEIRDRTFENQRYRASGLNLAVADAPRMPTSSSFLKNSRTMSSSETLIVRREYKTVSRA